MKDKINKLIKYISRSWEDEPERPHPRMEILPPFIYNILSYLIILAILYRVGLYLWSLI